MELEFEDIYLEELDLEDSYDGCDCGCDCESASHLLDEYDQLEEKLFSKCKVLGIEMNDIMKENLKIFMQMKYKSNVFRFKVTQLESFPDAISEVKEELEDFDIIIKNFNSKQMEIHDLTKDYSKINTQLMTAMRGPPSYAILLEIEKKIDALAERVISSKHA